MAALDMASSIIRKIQGDENINNPNREQHDKESKSNNSPKKIKSKNCQAAWDH